MSLWSRLGWQRSVASGRTAGSIWRQAAAAFDSPVAGPSFPPARRHGHDRSRSGEFSDRDGGSGALLRGLRGGGASRGCAVLRMARHGEFRSGSQTPARERPSLVAQPAGRHSAGTALADRGKSRRGQQRPACRPTFGRGAPLAPADRAPVARDTATSCCRSSPSRSGGRP
jgi:hypothetical protein